MKRQFIHITLKREKISKEEMQILDTKEIEWLLKNTKKIESLKVRLEYKKGMNKTKNYVNLISIYSSYKEAHVEAF